MGITDELREWAARELASWKMARERYDALTAIADRIDAEHERACKEQYACGVEHGIGASIEASMIQEHGFIELPKDADGMPIRVGDRLTNKHHKGTFTVVAIGGGINMHVVYFKNDDGSLAFHYANECHHCQPDTWEKIIEDALDADVDDFACMRDALVARCKALAGDNE